MPDYRDKAEGGAGMAGAAAASQGPAGEGSKRPVRGTQSFVRSFSSVWRRPWLVGFEVLWRWLYGIPAALILRHYVLQILVATPLDLQALREVTLLDPMRAAGTLGEALALLGPPVLAVAVWLGPMLAAVWIAVSSLGRTLVLRRADSALASRPGTLMVLQAVRMTALAAAFGLWFGSIRFAVAAAVTGPIGRGEEPSLVLYAAIVILASLTLFSLWSVVSWVFSMAPLLAMLRGLGVGASLRAALHLGALKTKLVEINLVMGIVKIALIVLAMVFSATPLPFEAVATAGFLFWWWVGVSVFYVVASDFFHVVRLVSYLDLWRAYEGEMR